MARKPSASPDYRGVLKRFNETQGGKLDRSWPMENVTCLKCGSESCLLYPAPPPEKANHEFKSSLVCFQCSDIVVEDFLRWQAMKMGYQLSSVGLFTQSWTPEWNAERAAWFAEQERLMVLAGSSDKRSYAQAAPTGPAIIDDAGFDFENRYRYWLTRGCTDEWTGTPRFVNFICLNPSTADAKRDDPTVRRLRGFAKSWGYDGFWLTNLFAFRATDPADLCFAQGDILGPDNLTWLRHVAARAALVVAAWGAVDGLYRNNVRFAERQANQVSGYVLAGHRIHVLGFTQKGFPRHPLYMKADTQPVVWLKGK